MRRQSITSHADRSFPRDAEHENGHFESRCSRCRGSFTGHKRRTVCRVCEEGHGMTPVGHLIDHALTLMTGRRPGAR